MPTKDPPGATLEQRMTRAASLARIRGPARVVVARSGEAVNWQSALARGVVVQVVFIRLDGWTLGAPKELVEVARGLGAGRWYGYYTRDDATVQPMPWGDERP